MDLTTRLLFCLACIDKWLDDRDNARFLGNLMMGTALALFAFSYNVADLLALAAIGFGYAVSTYSSRMDLDPQRPLRWRDRITVLHLFACTILAWFIGASFLFLMVCTALGSSWARFNAVEAELTKLKAEAWVE